MFGHKKAFIIGASINTMDSLLYAVSISPLIIDIARSFAGVGGTAIFSFGNAILIKTFNMEEKN
jgi:hypothetical protein